MANELSKDEIVNALRTFKTRRDNLLHEDESTFEHHLQRFVELCNSNPLVQRVLAPLEPTFEVNVDDWLQASQEWNSKLTFPTDPNQEFMLRYRVLEKAVTDERLIMSFGIGRGSRKRAEWISLFLSLIIRPFVDDLTYKVGEVANIASPEARAIQAVPFTRIPNQNETKIFLSHKSVDKPLVYRYYYALKQVGLDPWLDEPDMAAGVHLENGILRGFEQSCASVFFITESFKDENYLASEVEHAVRQKEIKNDKFAIITLRYPNAAPVPALLRPYIQKEVANDLEGFRELIRALPVELASPRWKAEIIES
jgi:hypothetical protein